MVICARCGKKVGFRDKIDDLFSYLNALKAGLFSEYQNKKICHSCQRELLESKGIAYKGLFGVSRGQSRIDELVSERNAKLTLNDQAPLVPLNDEVSRAILWQKDETHVGHINCREFFEDKNSTFGASVGNKGYLVITNQRILFACKLGFLAKNYGITYGINLEDIMSVSPGKFGLNDKLVILDKNSQHRDYVQPNIHSLIPIINITMSRRKEQLQSQKEKDRVHIVLDFSSLKETMSKGGIVMSTYNCPYCKAAIEIPEAGKILFCNYCGTPIKPIDIFERIKSFIQ